MDSKTIVQYYFPGAHCESIGNLEKSYYIVWQGSNLPSPFPTCKSQDEAWDICVKHPVTRERFLAIQHGILVKFLNETSKAISLVKSLEDDKANAEVTSTTSFFDDDDPTILSPIEQKKSDTSITVTDRDW